MNSISLRALLVVGVALLQLLGWGWGHRSPITDLALATPELGSQPSSALPAAPLAGIPNRNLVSPKALPQRTAVPNSEVESGPEPEIESRGDLPWKLIVRDALTRQGITSDLELRFVDDVGEEQVRYLQSAEEMSEMPVSLRDRKLTVSAAGYLPTDFHWRNRISFRVVRLMPKRDFIVTFVDSGVSERAYTCILRGQGRSKVGGLASGKSEPIRETLKRESLITVVLIPQVQHAYPSPVYERQFPVSLFGNTEVEIDLAVIPWFEVVDVRLKIEIQEPGLDLGGQTARIYSSLADGSAVDRVKARGESLRQWALDSAHFRERFVRGLPTGTYTLSVLPLGLYHTFTVWPNDEEHVERIVLPRLSHVTALAAGQPDAQGERLEPVGTDRLVWGYLSDKGCLEFLEQARRSRLTQEDLNRAVREKVARRTSSDGLGKWSWTCLPGRSVWVVYEGKWPRFAEPQVWTTVGGSSEIQLEVVHGP